MIIFRIITGFIILYSIGATQTPENRGYEIMAEALSQASWTDMTADMQLVLRNARGEERVREIAFYSSDDEQDLNRMLMRFKSPADVRGTGFLTLERDDTDDERYLYLPALRRVKKIAASGSGGNFMSSDFTYYDVGKPKLEDWTYTLLGEETYQGKSCYVIECIPSNDDVLDDTGYSKVIRTLTKDGLNSIHSEYYDEMGEKWKELEVREYVRIKDVDFATDMIMHDIQIDHSSEMRFENLKVDTDIPDSFFSVRYLQRGR